jgi:hypothetical protein
MSDQHIGFPLILASDGRQLDYDAKLEEYRSILKREKMGKQEWRSDLIDGPDGWMSPRMFDLLEMNADVTSEDDFLDDGHYEKFIPYDVLSRIQCSKHKFLAGLIHVIGKISETMRSARSPTVENVLKRIYGNYEKWEYRGEAKAYLGNGGRVEYAIDALLEIAEVSIDDGEFEQMLEDRDDGSHELPHTPFDEDYDLVRIMCMDRRCFESVEHCLVPLLAASTDFTGSYSDDYEDACDYGCSNSDDDW